MTRSVALYAHNLRPTMPTGVVRYAENLARAIALKNPTGIAYHMGSSPESNRGTDPDLGMPVLRPRGSRRAIHASWALTNRPRVDKALDRPDLLHVLYPYAPVPSKAPLVCTIHDVMPIQNPGWFSRRDRWLFSKSLAQAFDRAAMVITGSEYTARCLKDVLDLEAERITVIPYGVSVEFLEPLEVRSSHGVLMKFGVEPQRFLVVVGTVSTRKNLRPVIEAVASRPKAFASLKVLAIGPPGVGSAETESLVNELGLGDVVRFTGWIPDVELRALLSSAAALLHPSREEGFGLTPLEAMACGVPTAVANAGSLPEVVGDAGLILDPDDAQAWAGAIERVVNDEGLRQDLMERGQVRAARYSWSAAAQRTIEVHRSVLSI